MKRIMHILVAVATCFCVIAASVLPASAASVSDSEYVSFLDSDGKVLFSLPVDEFVSDDYLIPYELFYANDVPVTYSGGLLGFSNGIAWSEVFADAGYALKDAGLYACGFLLATGILAECGLQIYNILVNDVPEVYVDLVSVIYMSLDAEGQAWMAEAFNLIVEGEPLTVPVALSEQIADIMNGMTITDGMGNVIDTSISIPETAIAGVFVDGYPERLSFNGYEEKMSNRLLKAPVKSIDSPTYTAETEYLSWLSTYSDINGVWDGTNVITNKITGTSITFNLNSVMGFPRLVRMMSKFYNVSLEDGSSFWITFFAEDWLSTGSYNAAPFAPANISSEFPVVLNGTGTIVDGRSIISVTWLSDIAKWLYTFADGEAVSLPIDPLGMVLSNTGAGTAAVPGITAQPNTDDKTTTVPWVPSVPSAKDPSIGVPAVDDIITDIAQTGTKADTIADSVTLEADPSLDLGTPDGIKGFIGTIVDYFDGIFDWLPDDFRNVLDGVLITLQTVMLLMVVVKIVDIIWP